MRDDPIARWNEIRHRIEAKARRCVVDEEFAAEQKIRAEVKIPVTGGFAATRAKQEVEAPVVGYLRTIAKKEVPAEFRYEIVTTIGGGAFLALTDHDPPPEAYRLLERRDLAEL